MAERLMMVRVVMRGGEKYSKEIAFCLHLYAIRNYHERVVV